MLKNTIQLYTILRGPLESRLDSLSADELPMIRGRILMARTTNHSYSYSYYRQASKGFHIYYSLNDY